MVRLLFNQQTKVWVELTPEDPESDLDIVIDGIRRKYLDQVRADLQDDSDHVMIISGAVGTGKSTLGRLDCRYVSNEKFHPRTHVIRDEKDIKRVIQGAKKGECVLVDEGSMIFSAVDTMTKKQKYANLILDVVRQKNLLIVICAPNFHRLSSALAVDRSTTMTRVYKNNKTGKRGFFAFYGTRAKEKLYRFAKVNYGSLKGAKAKYRGRFKEDKTFTEEYKAVKDETLNIALDSLKIPGEVQIDTPPTKQEIVKDYQIKIVQNNMDVPLNDMVKLMGVSISTISRLREQAKGVMSNEI